MRRSHIAFTLIELLVVISIIALLIAILLPALEHARESGRQITCAAYLRGINGGATAYSVDNHDTFPFQWAGGSGHPSFSTWVVNKPLGFYSYLPSWIGLVHKYVTGTVATFTCPTAERFDVIDTGLAPDADNRFTYVANGVTATFGDTGIYRNTHIVTYRDDVRITGGSVLRPHWGASSDPSLDAPGWSGWYYYSSAGHPITDRPHGYFGTDDGGQNLARLDGSTQFESFRDITSLDFGLLIYGEDTVEPKVSSYTSPARHGEVVADD